MARINKGILGPIIGKIAHLVGYIRKGQPVLRSLPNKSNKPRSAKQKVVNSKFGLVSKFIASVHDFTNVGFKLDVVGKTRTAQNAAVSYNLLGAVKGEKPNFEIDYPKVMLSKGTLPPPLHPSIEFSGTTLKFNWEVLPNLDYELTRDQVMLIACLPTQNIAFHALSGARRTAGEDFLEVRPLMMDDETSKKDESIEAYIAFIADDRESISDSVYVGRILL